MRKTTWEKTKGRRILGGPALCVIVFLCLGATAVRAAEPSGPVQDMSSILGPGSQLQAAKDGEFTISLGENGDLDNFRAVKDVVVVTKDINCLCDELIYHRAQGNLTATAKAGNLVKITLRNMAAGPGGGDGKKTDTYATCRRYQFYINEQRHELSLSPVIYRTDENGKVTAISGDHITLTQDSRARWQMLVKGNPQIYDPKEKSRLKEAREKFGAQIGGTKPVVQIEGAEALGSKPKPPGPKPSAKSGAGAKSVKIDEGNVQKLRRPKSSKVVKIEEGG